MRDGQPRDGEGGGGGGGKKTGIMQSRKTGMLESKEETMTYRKGRHVVEGWGRSEKGHAACLACLLY
jgi:hypothetical protein